MKVLLLIFVFLSLLHICFSKDCLPDLKCDGKEVRINATGSLVSGPENCISGTIITIEKFLINIRTGKKERFDVGLFAATDGGEANSSTSNCERRVLQPVGRFNGILLPLPDGTGPYNNYDNDNCGELHGGKGHYVGYLFRNFNAKCIDTNGDGYADQSFCIGWTGLNEEFDCEGPESITDESYPSHKCRCTRVNLNIKII